MGTKILPKRTVNKDSIPIENGNLIFDTTDKMIYMDDEDGQRYQYGGKNIVDKDFNVASENAVANKVVTKIITEKNITLLKDNWSSVKPFTQTIEIEGMTIAGNPDVFLAYTDEDNESNDKLLQKNFGYIKYYDTENNSITFTCKYTKPTVDLPILLKGIY